MKKSVALTIVFVISSLLFAQQTPFTSDDAVAVNASGTQTAKSALAFQEFRRGVQAYYRGSFNDAILQFEKSLSYLPNENLILDWLGKSYYRSGIEGAALQQWQFASDNGYGGLLLKNQIEIVRERRITDNAYQSSVTYTEAGSFPGRNDNVLVFSQPISVLPEADGSVWVLAYGSNELVKIDINGLVVNRVNVPLIGFDRPMDMIRTKNGSILVSESAGDRVSVFTAKGGFVKSFGEKGIGVGQMVGPQYLAQDDSENIYVTDFGNARVDVFDRDGNGLFYFGTKSADFAGLTAPTGIAYANGAVCVADAVTGAVYRFDTAGNYLGLLCKEKTFIKPESMKPWGGYLVMCDKNRVYSIDVETGAVFENVSTGNAPSRVTCAVPDANGNVLVSDVVTNEVYIMAKMSELIGGLFVQIERVDATAFPRVTLEVKVENRHRQSIVGLKDVNFFVTERKGAVLDVKYEGSAHANDIADVTMIIDRSVSAAQRSEALERAVREIASSMNGEGSVRIISAGAMPVLEYTGSPSGVEKFSASALKNPVSSQVQLDNALRLAVNGLIPAEKKRAIIFLTDGDVSQGAFASYSLSDLSAYMNNNSVSMTVVMLSQGTPAREIAYLTEHTNGSEYYVYRNQGLSDVMKDILAIPNGMYRLSYTSQLKKEYGQAYLPVEIEAYLMNRSGRAETGYFAPLD
ncbi:MAG: hypothetical protein IJS09_00675 [Treponema sp.]|nr:hypothetical protein [Treponema sp.]